jgi:hypothetical protein
MQAAIDAAFDPLDAVQLPERSVSLPISRAVTPLFYTWNRAHARKGFEFIAVCVSPISKADWRRRAGFMTFPPEIEAR